MLIIIDVKELVLLDKQREFKDANEYHDFLMFEIQKHIVEINDLKAKKSSHVVNEAVDLSVLAGMLALSEGAKQNVYKKRIKKFKKKINA